MERTKTIDTKSLVGQKVLLQGWADTVRDHGQLLFVDLRDSFGKVQVVFNPELDGFELAKSIGKEYVISVEGVVKERTADMMNEKIETGKIEVIAERVEVINKAKPMPFPIDSEGREIDENLRLKYRYLDIRRERIQKIMRQKHDLMMSVRNWFDKNEFLEVITPLLTSTSPEGARDFVVPSRIFPGKFFVLPQAPQQYKQLLMVGGVDKYFQIAPCARDEDPRADRHAGIFYQIDIEMSFPTIDKIFSTCEQMIRDTYKVVAPDKVITQDSFQRIPYHESMERFGTDKPDTRFGLEIQDITDVVKGKTDFNVFNNAEVIKCVVAENCSEWSRTEILEMEAYAKSHGAKGLAYVKVTENGLETGVAKFLEAISKELIEKVGAKTGDLIFFGADKRQSANKILGVVRGKLGQMLNLIDEKKLAFAWITDFPFYELDDKTNKLDFAHNPFSMPQGGLKAFEGQDPLKIQTNQYDLALNGYEILSGSIRNHDPEVMIKAFETLGYTAQEVKKRFGGLYNAFQYGAPPHGGWAIGFDRFFMVLIDEPNIRDVYAFPMSASGQELMMNAPSELREDQLNELNIQVVLPQVKGGEKIKNAILKMLDEKSFEYKHMQHKEVKTSEESAEIRGTKLEEGAKALVVKGSNSKKNFMIVIPANLKLSKSKVEEVLAESIEFEKPEVIKEKWGLEVGAVPPFGEILGIDVYVDEKVKLEERVAFNCGLRSDSVVMKSADLVQILKGNIGDWSE